MRFVDPQVAARRAARAGTHAEALVWVEARNRSTGLIETMGLWTGVDHQIFTIGGESRTYYGAGNVLDVPDIPSRMGVAIQTLTISVAFASPEVEMLLRGYDPRLCRAEIHRAEFDADEKLIATPERLFKGWINGAPSVTPAIGGAATASLELVSNARMLTRRGSATKSDQYQRRRSGDRFRRYATLAESATVYWGEERAAGVGKKAVGTAKSRDYNMGGDR